MIEQIYAKVVLIESKMINIVAGCFFLHVNANGAKFKLNVEQDIFVHWHWSTETGPALFGFATKAERQAFRILLDCPKIGPTAALNILMQVDAVSLFTLIVQEDERSLAKINGIGPKSAKNLVSFVKEKAMVYLQNYSGGADGINEANVWLLDVRAALVSLGYAESEISRVLAEINKKAAGASCDFNQCLRQALALLQKK